MNREQITKQAQNFKRAQGAILTVFAFTVVNILSYQFGFGINFLFSAVIPELIALIAAPVWGLLVAPVYLGLWYWTKKWTGAVLIALILFSVDSFVLLVLVLLTGEFGNFIFDILFAGWILHNLITGTIAWGKLSNVNSDLVAAVQDEIENDNDAEINETLDAFPNVPKMDTSEFDFGAPTRDETVE